MKTKKLAHVTFSETLEKAKDHWVALMKDFGFPSGYMNVFNGLQAIANSQTFQGSKS
jgi:hypothetical protein